jgi:hypothetical protein
LVWPAQNELHTHKNTHTLSLSLSLFGGNISLSFLLNIKIQKKKKLWIVDTLNRSTQTVITQKKKISILGQTCIDLIY